MLGAFGGDLNRWYLLSCAVAVTLCCLFVEGFERVPRATRVAAAAMGVAIVLLLDVPYFDRDAPRAVNPEAVAEFVREGFARDWSKIP